MYFELVWVHVALLIKRITDPIHFLNGIRILFFCSETSDWY